MALVAFIAAALFGFLARLRNVSRTKAWLFGCVVVPALVLFEEFVLPYSGGGASLWPIALFFGGVYGAVASGLGVFVAKFFMRGGPNGA